MRVYAFKQAFCDKDGTILTKRCETTMHGTTSIQVVENDNNYYPKDLTPISNEEYQEHLNERRDYETIQDHSMLID